MYPIIYSDDDFLIVSKPPFISVHCDDQITGFAYQLSQQLHTKLYVVHRLDKVTSGLMIFAKTASIAAVFGKMFESRQITKYYLAIAETKPTKKQGTIKGDMKKSRRGAWKLLKSFDNPAITRFISKNLPARGRVFLLKPETGKTHQLRVALKSIGAAIVGDPLYASGKNMTANTSIAGGECKKDVEVPERCYLHAWQLSFCLSNQSFDFRDDPKQGALFLTAEFLQTIQQWADVNRIKWSKG
ncbi:MAG: hypothetical protein OFPII_07760 [Osedax symbiont Rs1]|nr:MAG: hypothetical protein OFPII_07760 [Osedax symbiont Rs1]